MHMKSTESFFVWARAKLATSRGVLPMLALVVRHGDDDNDEYDVQAADNVAEVSEDKAT